MSHDQSKVVEWAAYLFAGIAAVSLAQAAVIVTLLAGAISVILGAIKLHDRIVYGPIGGRE